MKQFPKVSVGLAWQCQGKDQIQKILDFGIQLLLLLEGIAIAIE